MLSGYTYFRWISMNFLSFTLFSSLKVHFRWKKYPSVGTPYIYDRGMQCHSTRIELFYFDDNFCQYSLCRYPLARYFGIISLGLGDTIIFPVYVCYLVHFPSGELDIWALYFSRSPLNSFIPLRYVTEIIIEIKQFYSGRIA